MGLLSLAIGGPWSVEKTALFVVLDSLAPPEEQEYTRMSP